MGKKIRKYTATLIDVNVAAIRSGMAQMNHALASEVPADRAQLLEARLLFSEMVDWLEARRDSTQ